MIDIGREIFNISVGKAVQQSSVSVWAAGRTPHHKTEPCRDGEANNSPLLRTNFEDEAWLQINLANVFAITEVRIFSNADENLQFGEISVLISLSDMGDDWVETNINDNVIVSGVGDNCCILRFDGPVIGRFVRLQKNERGYLDVCKCEVFGYMPDADERGRVVANKIVDQHEFAAYQQMVEVLRHGREGYASNIGKFHIFVDTGSYSKVLVDVLSSGSYESRERRIIAAAMQPTDRVLEVGTAIGAVTMTAASIVTPAQVVTYDANPAMIADAKRNFVANHMAGIQASVGVMRNRRNWIEGETEVDFFVSRDFWASSLFVSGFNTDIIETISVPLLCLEDEIQRHRANVLVCDIEGGEAALLLDADLANIRMIILETHYPAVGRQKIDGMVRYLIAEGFNINLDYSSGHILLLDREL
jgi:FkbM family methyltransferase